jgi:hypothetical protein
MSTQIDRHRGSCIVEVASCHLRPASNLPALQQEAKEDDDSSTLDQHKKHSLSKFSVF